MRDFVSELRRRNVLRVAAAYALSAWIIIEAGSVLLPAFGASEHVFRIYVVVVVAGFVAAVVLAWVFEVTPDGVKLDRNADRSSPAVPRRRQRMNYTIIALLIAALMVSITFNIKRDASTESRTTAAEAPRSIAVLPFTSSSNNPENELFAAGIHDDLLTRLANIKALKVISRTSVMQYRDIARNVREIGNELGVQSVLEGGVQRSGDAVRINLRLMDARTDKQIWAKTYDRQLTMQNVFLVQSEISGSVAEALQATLSPDERVRMAAVPTVDLRAFRLYKEATNNVYQRRLETLRVARQQFGEAIELDPDYAEAHAGLAEATFLLWNNHQDLPEGEAMPIVERSLERALEINPELADAHALTGLMKSTLWGRSRVGNGNADAEAAFRRAIAINANHASAYMWFASLRDMEDRLDEAIGLYQKSLELDPLARIPHSNLAMVYAKAGQQEAAMRLLLQAARIHSEWPTIYRYIATQLWGLGRLDEAYAWHDKAVEVSRARGVAGTFDVGIMADLGAHERAQDALKIYPADDPFYPMVEGLSALIDGDFDKAAAHFARLIENELVPAQFAYQLASDSALLAGDFEGARKYVIALTPILGGDTAVRVDRAATRSAVKLAFIEQRLGNHEHASELLTETLDVIRDLPRLGTHGFGIRDVQIYAILGRKEDALAAFREALDEGFRGSTFFDNWPLSVDPYLDSIRDDPRFATMVDELDGYLVALRERLFEAESAGRLDDLRALAERT